MGSKLHISNFQALNAHPFDKKYFSLVVTK